MRVSRFLVISVILSVIKKYMVESYLIYKHGSSRSKVNNRLYLQPSSINNYFTSNLVADNVKVISFISLLLGVKANADDKQVLGKLGFLA